MASGWLMQVLRVGCAGLVMGAWVLESLSAEP